MDNLNEKIENQGNETPIDEIEAPVAAPAEEIPAATPSEEETVVAAPTEEAPAAPAEEAPVESATSVSYCSKCGFNLGEMNFCPNCGTAKAASPAAPVAPVAPAAPVNPAYPAYQQPVNQYYVQPAVPQKKKLPVWLFIIIGVAVLIFGIIIIGAIAGGSSSGGGSIIDNGPDLEEVYEEIGSPYYAEVASDGSYLTIDTNYFDSDDYIDMEAYYDVEEVVELLDLPESLIEEFGQTRALDGRLTRTYDDITVSWSYHPDSGLEVMFEKN